MTHLMSYSLIVKNKAPIRYSINIWPLFAILYIYIPIRIFIMVKYFRVDILNV